MKNKHINSVITAKRARGLHIYVSDCLAAHVDRNKFQPCFFNSLDREISHVFSLLQKFNKFYDLLLNVKGWPHW